jgi:hypothetical protein
MKSSSLSLISFDPSPVIRLLVTRLTLPRTSNPQSLILPQTLLSFLKTSRSSPRPFKLVSPQPTDSLPRLVKLQCKSVQLKVPIMVSSDYNAAPLLRLTICRFRWKDGVFYKEGVLRLHYFLETSLWTLAYLWFFLLRGLSSAFSWSINLHCLTKSPSGVPIVYITTTSWNQITFLQNEIQETHNGMYLCQKNHLSSMPWIIALWTTLNYLCNRGKNESCRILMISSTSHTLKIKARG